MGSVMKRIQEKIQAADAAPPADEWMVLSHDTSVWKSNLFASVTKEVPGAENVTISGTFLTKVFVGPYKDAGGWYKSLNEYVQAKGKETMKIYFFYTTCPKCANHYGKNYTIGFAQVA